tara:strand:+ start:1389 stop:4079 length:2691 start_codon:yes stop_codon:yes gene_type:complete
MVQDILSNESLKKEWFDKIMTNSYGALQSLVDEHLSQGKEKVTDLRGSVRELLSGYNEDNILFDYLLEKSTTSEPSKSAILLKTKGGYRPQNWIIEKLPDSEYDEASEAMAQVLISSIEDLFTGFRRFKKTNSGMVKYLIQQIETPKGRMASAVETETGADLDKRINETLRKFKVLNGKPLTRRKLAEMDSLAISDVIFVKRITDENELNQMLVALASEEDAQMRVKFRPLIRRIERELESDLSVQAEDLDSDKLIGRLDLKFLSRRNQIYSYWEEIDGKFSDLEKAVVDFSEGLESIETENEKLQDIIKTVQKYSKEFKEFPDSMKYTIAVEPLTMKDRTDKRDKYFLMFERFLNNEGVFGEDSSDVEDNTGYRTYDEGKGTGQVGETSMDAGISPAAKEKLTVSYGKDGSEEKNPDPEEEARQRSRLGRKLKDLWENKKVDPLFYYVFAAQDNKERKHEVWADGPLFAKEIKRLKRRFTMKGVKSYLVIDDRIEDYVDKISLQLSAEKDMYFLPVTDKVAALVSERGLEIAGDTKINQFQSSIDNIEEFLSAISMIIDSGDGIDRLSAPSMSSEFADTREEKPSLSVSRLGSQRKSDFLGDIKELQEEFNTLLEAIVDYYITPMSSKYMPFDNDSVPFKKQTTTDLFRKMTQDISDANAFFMLLALESKYDTQFINKRQLEKLAEVMGFLSSPSKTKEMREVKRNLNKLKRIVMEVFGALGKSVKGDLDVELGNFLHDVATKNNLSDVKWSSKNTNHWSEKYDNGYIYPIEALESFLRRRKEGFNTKETKSAYDSVMNAIDDMQIVKSETELQILHAHDTIRKMVGKPVFYNTSKTHNFNHINDAIDTISKQYKVTLTANEIEKIVHTVDSMDSLSKEYGIPSESVYFLKASFR